MACTTVYTHISLLTSKGLTQRGGWRRRMKEKEVRNEWSQYGLRTVTECNWSHGDYKKTCSEFTKIRVVEDETPKEKGKGKAT
jgi:hypothetical protein